ncbi:STAS/SEC14 domain-containing protein [Sphingopyxis sp. GC21]|uniref:STAS/SEC14 domain-containing protein n=1 Tax=Sphingopyxis sp. GC21 TaxID=2933562 RepID=UPI0021E36708|nr:STAS/SEC14 domain-containing protein [Sphingopyxis sp. GC21]
MLTELSDAQDIIAVSISGRLERADVERIMQRLDAAFARHGKVHIFAEVRAFEGMSADAWLSDIRHGLGYLGRLGQFGRIAIVSDQSWIRIASRIESALLPFVSYEVFTPEHRDHALAWVKGEIDVPRPPAVTLADEDGFIRFDVNGRITRENIEALQARIEAVAGAEVPLRLLTRIRAYDGFDPAILVDPECAALKLSLLRRVARYAIVGGPEWMERIVQLSAPLLRMEFRHFDSNEEQAARDWLISDKIGN